ncbi:hypothetical protein [Microbaculum sp. FT89]|uniref:hypothetical protein n=1 Tax=Microbaculum sp. FT89 TaxID=3447298 RepID=UPI003F5303D5
MAIGGKFHLANQTAQSKRFNYGTRMNRQAVQQGATSAKSYATSLFSINASAGQELVNLAMRQAVTRIEADVQARNRELQKAAESFNSLNEIFA